MKFRVLFLAGGLLGTFAPLVPTSVAQIDTRATVRIDATGRIAEENSNPLRRLRQVGEFTISRQGPTETGLGVFVAYSGSATYGVDYGNLPTMVMIPPGAISAVIRVEAKDDGISEPIETLVATISNCSPNRDPAALLPCYDFIIAPSRTSATVFIRDDGVTQSSIGITNPKDGDKFETGTPIAIRAVAIDLNGYISQMDFFDGPRKIGESQISFFAAPPPGTPIEHRFTWNDAAAGPHSIFGQSRLGDGTIVTSAVVNIEVRGTNPPVPVVRIDATRPVAEEDSSPLDRLALVGEFTISRMGPTNSSLPVYVQFAGSAIPGKDYKALPFLVSIPAGGIAVPLGVRPIPDAEIKGMET